MKGPASAWAPARNSGDNACASKIRRILQQVGTCSAPALPEIVSRFTDRRRCPANLVRQPVSSHVDVA